MERGVLKARDALEAAGHQVGILGLKINLYVIWIIGSCNTLSMVTCYYDTHADKPIITLAQTTFDYSLKIDIFRIKICIYK